MVLKIWKSPKWVKFEHFEKTALWENLLGLFVAILFVIFFLFSQKNYFTASERLNVSILSCLRKTNVFFIILDHFLQKRNRIEMLQIVRFRQHCRKTVEKVLKIVLTLKNNCFSGHFFEKKCFFLILKTFSPLKNFSNFFFNCFSKKMSEKSVR